MADPQSDPHKATLGETDEIFHLHRVDTYGQLVLHMVKQAHRSIDLLTPDLEPQVFDQGPLITALKQLALKSRIARIRILLQDNSLVRTQGHRLTELAQRLTSTIEIRKPDKEFAQYPESFLLVDDCGYLHRGLADRYEATACFNNRLQVAQLENVFVEAWEAGEPDIELARLHL